MTFISADAVRNAFLDAVLDKCDDGAGAGSLTFFKNAVPSVNAARVAGNILAQLTLSDPAAAAAGASVAGRKDFNSITDDTSAAAGAVTNARLEDSDGNCIAQFTCGEAAEELVFAESTFTAGATVRVTGFKVAEPAS